MEEHFGVRRALLTHSCTAPWRWPPFCATSVRATKSSCRRSRFRPPPRPCAARRHPVFVDIRPDNCNLDETLFARAITPRTKVIVAGPLRGRVLRMDTIMDLARAHGLLVVETRPSVFLHLQGPYAGSLGDSAV